MLNQNTLYIYMYEEEPEQGQTCKAKRHAVNHLHNLIKFEYEKPMLKIKKSFLILINSLSDFECYT